MTRACFFTHLAELDLEEIGDLIARDNPLRAVSFVAELRLRCREIAVTPQAAPLRPDLGEGVRLVPFRRYLLLYSLREEGIVIERVVHRARRLDDLL